VSAGAQNRPVRGASKPASRDIESHDRPLIPTQDCQSGEELKPDHRGQCGESLTGSDPAPLRAKVWEIPQIRPLVMENQLHRLICHGCCTSTGAELPTGVPQSQAGPRIVLCPS
jgi:hypothetical protein